MRALTVGLLLTPLLMIAAPVMAQADPPPDRIFNLVVYGDEACPRSDDPNDIVVCARKPESERYRIPKKLREKPDVVGGPGWGSQVATMENVQRQILPNSCSAIGSNGFTGCNAARLQQWFAERRMQQQADQP